AHPMYPRGSNGAAQAAIDARILADCLGQHVDRREALVAYEKARRETTAKVVRTNREFPPDFINIKVEELVGDRPFDDLDRYITQDELRTLSENYKRIAGFSLADVQPEGVKPARPGMPAAIAASACSAPSDTRLSAPPPLGRRSENFVSGVDTK